MKLLKTIVFAFLCIFTLTGCSNAFTLGESFFTFIHQGELKKAFNMTSPEFRKSTTFEGFQYTITQHKLQNIRRIEWNEAHFENETGNITATLHFQNETAINTALQFIKTADQWKIIAITFSDPFFSNDIQLPEQTEYEDLIRTTLNRFFNDVLQKDFSPSYNSLAQHWKNKLTLQEFHNAFENYILLEDSKKNFEYIKTAPITLINPPKIAQSNEGLHILILEGSIDTKTQKAIFSLQYIYEDELWRLVGISLQTQ